MIKIIAGTIFGVFFVAPALSIPIERMEIDTTGIQAIFSDLGSEILKIVLEGIKQAI